MAHLLIVVAGFYEDIAGHQLAGAEAALKAASHTHEVVRVPGALEIPPAIALAEESGKYDGYVALGCVIRGETSHYDTVCNESARGIMDLGIYGNSCIGNGILTVEDRHQAMARADASQKNKGGGAAEAAIALMALKQRYVAEE